MLNMPYIILVNVRKVKYLCNSKLIFEIKKRWRVVAIYYSVLSFFPYIQKVQNEQKALVLEN